MTKSISRVVGCATLLWVGTALATPTPQQNCERAKLKAQGALQRCLKRNSASIIGGKTDASATCQTKFTTALATADARATRARTSCHYLDNGDGTVSDLNTGLVWEQKVVGGIHDVNATYTWSSNETLPDGTAFTGLLGTLNGGTSSDGTAVTTPCFTGHCDWRLPTVQELQGILDLSPSPTIVAYWSATTYDGTPSSAWFVNFPNGRVYFYGKIYPVYVRAVRGGL